MIECPKCSQPVDWRPHKTQGRLIITFRCCDANHTAKADFVITEIREGWLSVVPKG